MGIKKINDVKAHFCALQLMHDDDATATECDKKIDISVSLDLQLINNTLFREKAKDAIKKYG